jgi:hypothetical protein
VAQAALILRGITVIEEYELLMQLAQAPGTESKKLAAEAYGLMPDRREALALLINYAIIDGQHGRAMELAEAMMALGDPAKTYWSMNHEWYGWKGAELYRQCLRLNGREKEADNDWESCSDRESPTFSIVHATLERPEKALAIREMWMSRASKPENVDYVFGLHEFDKKSKNIIRGFKHSTTEERGSSKNYDIAAGESVGDIIIQGQDDCYPPQGWDDMIADAIPDTSKPVFLSTSDGQKETWLTINTIMTRAYMDIKAKRETNENGFFHRGYFSVYPDTENSHRAIEDGKNGICEYINARHIDIIHDHPTFNPEIPWDETYETENAVENYKSGLALFHERNPSAPKEMIA